MTACRLLIVTAGIVTEVAAPLPERCGNRRATETGADRGHRGLASRWVGPREADRQESCSRVSIVATSCEIPDMSTTLATAEIPTTTSNRASRSIDTLQSCPWLPRYCDQ